ncbi:MAG: hypothetical protein CVT63_01155 [Candidatus Anoxymicrobium japonicum]|uniref:Metallopeptidase family protein n=1 Tax=Candidatus Anoxymicrobium japonicum TaxID=2013648 RepID=A0A2N3G7Q3_9ACTN|nr:MAG: hypothetical protein CVT63_01155 [Candidatus Anoxymicrobium japonicum]
MKIEDFSLLVEKVIEGLPEDFSAALDEGNVSVVAQEHPDRSDLDAAGITEHSALLGLYQGVPPTSRGRGYSLVLPDKITIYKEPIEQYARQTRRSVTDVVREVVLHEIAHHFGLPDWRLRELGY